MFDDDIQCELLRDTFEPESFNHCSKQKTGTQKPTTIFIKKYEMHIRKSTIQLILRRTYTTTKKKRKQFQSRVQWPMQKLRRRLDTKSQSRFHLYGQDVYSP